MVGCYKTSYVFSSMALLSLSLLKSEIICNEKFLVNYFWQHRCHSITETDFPLKLDVGYQFLHAVPAQAEWKSIKLKENSVFHGASLNFHRMNSYWWICCFQHRCYSITGIDFFLFACGILISANCFS